MRNRKKLFIAIMRDFFGDRWFLPLFFLAIVLFWPVIVFRGSIAFDPVNFTEEWLKLGVGGFVVLLIIEITRRQQEETTEVRLRQEQVANAFIRPVEQLLSLLQSIGQRFDKSNALRGNILARWTNLYPQLNAGNAQELLRDFDVLDLLANLDRERCTNIIESIAAQEDGQQIDQGEFDELVNRLTSFKKQLTEDDGKK